MGKIYLTEKYSISDFSIQLSNEVYREYLKTKNNHIVKTFLYEYNTTDNHGNIIPQICELKDIDFWIDTLNVNRDSSAIIRGAKQENTDKGVVFYGTEVRVYTELANLRTVLIHECEHLISSSGKILTDNEYVNEKSGDVKLYNFAVEYLKPSIYNNPYLQDACACIYLAFKDERGSNSSQVYGMFEKYLSQLQSGEYTINTIYKEVCNTRYYRSLVDYENGARDWDETDDQYFEADYIFKSHGYRLGNLKNYCITKLVAARKNYKNKCDRVAYKFLLDHGLTGKPNPKINTDEQMEKVIGKSLKLTTVDTTKYNRITPSPLNEYQYNKLFESGKFNKDYTIIQFLNETAHYHKFLEPVVNQLCTAIKNIITDDLFVTGCKETKISLNCKYTDSVTAMITPQYCYTKNDIYSFKKYSAQYINTSPRLDENGKLTGIYFTIDLPYNLENNRPIYTTMYLESFLSHEVTHMYDDWIQLTKTGTSMTQSPRRVTNPENSTPIIGGLLKIAYFTDKPEEKAFVNMSYKEFERVGVSYKNFQTKMKETLPYKQYFKTINEIIPQLEKYDSILICVEVKNNEGDLIHKGIPLPKKDEHIDIYKNRVISWCYYQIKQFLKKFGGILTYYLETKINKPMI
jgi:hypothetical protein